MDNQPITSMPPTPFTRSGPSPWLIALLAILGLGTLGFGILAAVLYNQASTATRTLNTQKATAAAQARDEQKQADARAANLAAESPFRSYVAPPEFGSFEIKFPKNWSSAVAQNRVGTQVSLSLNPDFIRRINNVDELMAARVVLQETPKDQYMTAFSSLIKRGTLKQADITVSGLPGYDLTGSFSDKRTIREVVVPVRDKVLVFSTENNKYATEFGQILAQAKVIP